MDNFGERLRKDAAQIDARISSELDRRIHAGLDGVEPQSVAVPAVSRRSSGYRWWGSLAGAAAVIVLALAVHFNRPEAVQEPTGIGQPVMIASSNIDIDTLRLVAPLQEEMDNLQADLNKVGNWLRKDIPVHF